MSHSIHPDHLECWRYKRGLCNGVRHKAMCEAGCTPGPLCGPQCKRADAMPHCCSEIKRATIYIEE